MIVVVVVMVDVRLMSCPRTRLGRLVFSYKTRPASDDAFFSVHSRRLTHSFCSPRIAGDVFYVESGGENGRAIAFLEGQPFRLVVRPLPILQATWSVQAGTVRLALPTMFAFALLRMRKRANCGDSRLSWCGGSGLLPRTCCFGSQ